MCGIAGLMTANGSAPDPLTMAALIKALGHRGPDGQGQYQKGDTALIQTRLAIIDLKTGDQPFYEPGGSVLVANGEIYNYIELRAKMTNVSFATQSDCETPLFLYRTHGLDFARHLRGMFALAIHDTARGRLVLARDPFGIKPLYYAATAAGFAFASEPHALVESGWIGAKLLNTARNELLQLQFTTGRATIFGGIERVLPGEIIVIEKGRIVERLAIEALPRGSLVEDAGCEALDMVLADSVGVHQRSDVPYGMFLSGGIDSSALLAMMARLNPRPVKAFTVGFSGTTARDEREMARDIAQSFAADYSEIDFNEVDFWSVLPEVVSAMDDPAADYAILPTWKLAKTARAAGIKVILSGEGGDELFGGYGRYRSAMRPRWLGGRPMRRKGTFDGLGILKTDLAGWRTGMATAEREAMKYGRTRLQIAQAVDCADWLPNNLLTKLDRCLMAHGIEGRTPFLDPETAAFAFRLPDRLKVRDGLGKILLREWLHKHAPVADAYSKKRGFTVPVGEWIGKRGAEIGRLVAAQDCIREICHIETVEHLFRNAGQKNAAFAAWTLLFYALWYRRHIECRPFIADAFATLAEK